MMENLQLQDGSSVVLRLKHLPKVTHVKFQPLHYSFSALPDPKTRSALHHYAKGYTLDTDHQ